MAHGSSFLRNLFISVSLVCSVQGLWWPFSSSDLEQHNCTTAEVECKGNNSCVKKEWVCDNYRDCPGGEDELDCKKETCPFSWFKCKNGRCIDPDFKCDGEDQCADRSDEQACSEGDLKTCDLQSFRCAKGEECVPTDFVCDGSEDCLDGSDERNCGAVKCERHEFLCVNTTLCIAQHQVCDDVPDCEDGSDELLSMCLNRTRCTSKPGYFMCTNMEKCLDVRKVCDGKDDCTDGSDEPKNCSTICKELKCEQGCAPYKGNVSCVCMMGYHLGVDRKSCKDIDECRVEKDWMRKCSQNCSNSQGSYSCNCIDGYDLEPDYHRCKAKGDEPILFYSTRTVISKINLRSNDTSLFRSDLVGVTALATDSKRKTVFWSSNYDKKVYSSRIYERVLYRKVPVVSVGLVSPVALSYDWIGDNLYIVDDGRKEIIVCKSDGISCTVILANLTSPMSLAVDPHNRNMYFTETGARTVINRSWLDGRNVEKFVSKSLGKPTSLVVDYTVNRLYWTDRQWDRIESIDLDGKNRKVVLAHEVKNPSLLAIMEDTMYWSEYNKHNLRSGNKLTGRQQTYLVRDIPATTDGVILHSSLQTKERLGNSCSLKKCSHMCLLSGNKKGFSCACPQGYQLREDMEICRRKSSSKVLLVAHKTDILQFPLEYIGNDPLKTLSTDDVGGLFSLGYDPVSRHIIHATMNIYNQPIICQTSVESNRARHKHEVIASGMKMITGIAVDWVGRNVFWTDAEKRTVEVSRLNRPIQAVLLTSKQLDRPSAIALDLKHGSMFISDWGETVYINKCDMDGENCFHLIAHRLGNPNSLTVDMSTGRLYWTDARLGEIVSVTVDGENRITHTVSTEEPLSLALSDNIIYWTDWKTDYIHSLNLTNNQKTILHRGKESMTGLTLIHDIESIHNACSYNNGGCSHLCLAKHSNTSSCRCPEDLKLDVDNKTCLNDSYECKPGEMKCRPLASCLSSEKICDDNVDCPNKIDEMNCPVKCKGKQFRCPDGKCIPPRWMCDGAVDCVNATDEEVQNCVPVKCNNRQFRCTKYLCILKTLVCNHIEDCPNGTDEVNCLVKCPANDFQCVDDGWCLSKDKQCDGHEDCRDGSDEKTCHEDRCLVNNGNCSHKCEMYKGKALCYCRADYELSSDNKTCIAKGVRPYLLVSNDDGIHSISTNGHNGKNDLLISTPTPAVHLDIITSTGSIIWSTVQESGNLSTIHSITGNQSHVILDVRGSIEGLAVDWLNRVVYYTTFFNETGSIGFCNIDRVVCYTLLEKTDWNPKAIAVHPLRSKLFWMESSNQKLMVSWMDATHAKKVITTQIYKPVGLSIDYVKDRIYWIDSFFGWIKSVDLNGDHVQTISGKILNAPTSLDVFENSAYIADESGVSKMGVYHDDKIVISGIAGARGVRVVHPIKQSPGAAVCKDYICQYLCVPTPIGPKCLCPDNYNWNLTSAHCITDSGEIYASNVTKKQHSSIVLHQDLPHHLPSSTPLLHDHMCNLTCQNGGSCIRKGDQHLCSCPSGYNGSLCEGILPSATAPVQNNGGIPDKKLWIIGVVLGGILIICFVVGLVYYLRSKNKDVTLVSMIKYRNPNIGRKCEEAEELVPEISFNNPGFQACDDVSHDQENGDWWQTLMQTSTRASVDSAFISRDSSLTNSNSSNDSR